jgi:hypothetical protein
MKATLTNGTKMIARLEARNGDAFVAADTGHNFATWAYNDDDGSTFWGHYFETREEALINLVERAGLA